MTMAEQNADVLDWRRDIGEVRARAGTGAAEALRLEAAHALMAGEAGMSSEAALRDLGQAAVAGDAIAAELVARAQEWMAEPYRADEPEVVSEAPYIAFWQGFLSPFECAYVMAAARGALRPSDVIDSKTGKQTKSEVRVSETAWWQPDRMDVVLRTIFEKTVSAFGGSVALAEPTSVVRYQPGGIFLAHVDAYKNHATDEIDDSARATTSIIYLNDGYEGGGTAFIEPKLKISGMAGDMLHFRNLTAEGEVDPASVHAGMPVTSGEKWVLVQWVRRDPGVRREDPIRCSRQAGGARAKDGGE